MKENSHLRKQSDNSLGQLKIIYENERQTLEGRLNEERES